MLSFSELSSAFDDYLEKNKFPAEPAGLYAPCDYLMDLGGKRLRPLMVLLAYQLFKKKIAKAMPVALSVELFHNFSLMHDDIMDNSPLRRGKPTVHNKWSVNTAILSGDMMLIQAYKYLSVGFGSKTTQKMLHTFNRVATGVCEGQQYDVDFEQRGDVSIPEYLKMIELKTAVLLGGALELGALAAKAPAENAKHLYEFGRLAGIAFQIQDDYLDAFGDPEQFGKQVGGDILQNKKTYLLLKCLELASEEDKMILQRLYSGSMPGKVEMVKEIFVKYKIPALVMQLKERLESEAFAHLDNLPVNENEKNLLETVVAKLLHRQK